ncbi:MAG TPA: 50S ribosomal protein L18 [Terriglobia bacterium]|nr:50S ribosomal protein L18 [Terriglobia bacterium]
MIKKNSNERLLKKKTRIRKKISGTPERPRLTVYRSQKHVYAQIIDDVTGKTLVMASTLSKDLKDEIAKVKSPTQICKIIGVAAAKKALEKNIHEVVFDRNGYLYHGRVKAIADGAREAGLKF